VILGGLKEGRKRIEEEEEEEEIWRSTRVKDVGRRRRR